MLLDVLRSEVKTVCSTAWILSIAGCTRGILFGKSLKFRLERRCWSGLSESKASLEGWSDLRSLTKTWLLKQVGDISTLARCIGSVLESGTPESVHSGEVLIAFYNTDLLLGAEPSSAVYEGVVIAIYSAILDSAILTTSASRWSRNELAVWIASADFIFAWAWVSSY